MYSIAAAIGAGLIVGLIIALTYSALAAIIPAVFVVILVFFLLARHFMAKLQEVATASMKQLEAQKWDAALETLQNGYKFANWMVYAKSQLDGQIGYIHYVRKDFDKAFPYLEGSFVKNFMAQLMLAACYFRKKDAAKVEEVLEKAAVANKDAPLVWGVYGWMMEELGQSPKALQALSRGVEANPKDEALKTNLLNLQNKRRLNMKLFGDVWYQFWFEELPNNRRVPSHPRFQPQGRRR